MDATNSSKVTVPFLFKSNASNLTYNCSSLSEYEAPYFSDILSFSKALNTFHSAKVSSPVPLVSAYLNKGFKVSFPFKDFVPAETLESIILF